MRVGVAAEAAESLSQGVCETPDIETSSDAYAQRFAGPVGAWFLRVQEQAVLKMLASWPAATVLEVGGGHGQLTGALVREGYRVTVMGSDASCQQRIKPLVDEGCCRFAMGDLLNLPYSAQSFDVVVSLRLVPHVQAWPKLVGELTRVARHAVVVDYPTTRSLNCLTPALFGAKRRLEGNTRPYLMFRDAEIAQAFSAYGFVCQARYPEFFWPMVLHRVLRAPGVSAVLEGVARAIRLTRWYGSPVIALFTRDTV